MKRLFLPVLAFVGACSTVPAPSPYRRRFLAEGSARDVVVDGRKIHLIDRGQGPPVLFLHGLGGSAYDFRYQIDEFVAAGFRVIVPDMIGSGYSDKPVEWEYTVPAHAESMVRLLDALGLTKAHLVGNSYGGGAALAMAVAHPARVARLVLIDAACYPQEFPKHVKLMRAPVIGDFLLTIVPTRWTARALLEEIYCDPSRLSEEEIVEYVHEHRFVGAERTLRAMALKLDDPKTQEMHRHIPEIAQPTLVVWGENDRILFPSHAARLREEIKGSRVRMVPHCGHVPHMEYPSAINRLMLQFLKE